VCKVLYQLKKTAQIAITNETAINGIKTKIGIAVNTKAKTQTKKLIAIPAIIKPKNTTKNTTKPNKKASSI
jgi:hypothetical protein